MKKAEKQMTFSFWYRWGGFCSCVNDQGQFIFMFWILKKAFTSLELGYMAYINMPHSRHCYKVASLDAHFIL